MEATKAESSDATVSDAVLEVDPVAGEPGPVANWYGAPRRDENLARDFESRTRERPDYGGRFLALFASDVAVVVVVTALAWVSSESLRPLLSGGVPASSLPTDLLSRFLMLVMPALMLVGMSYNAGHYTRFKPIWLETREFLKISVYTISSVSVLLYITDGHFSRLWFVSFWSPIVVLLPLSRLFTKRLLMRRGVWFRPVVIFGTGQNACKSAEAIESDPMLGLRVASFVRTVAEGEGVVMVPEERIVELDHWLAVAADGPEREHFLFAPDTTVEFERNRLLLNRLSSCSRSITISPPFHGLPLDGAEIVNIPRSDAVLLRLQNNLAKRHAVLFKRLFDIGVSSLGLLLLAPLFAVLIACIKLDGGPAFYRQRRIGKNGVSFDCWKLRSMVVNGEEALRLHLAANNAARLEWQETQKLRSDPRVTRIGHVIRATSIDELPQLWNVLRGDMSMVGPRPIVFDERERYGYFLSYYLNQSPGITGLWQISGRNDTSYARRVDLDVWYSRNWSFWLDLVILARTLPAVLKGSGAY